MKSKALSDINMERHIIQCDCQNPQHLLIADYDKENHMIKLYFTDNWRASFFQRVINAFRYVFYRKNYCINNVVSIGLTSFSLNDLNDLKEWIEDIEKYKKEI